MFNNCGAIVRASAFHTNLYNVDLSWIYNAMPKVFGFPHANFLLLEIANFVKEIYSACPDEEYILILFNVFLTARNKDCTVDFFFHREVTIVHCRHHL